LFVWLSDAGPVPPVEGSFGVDLAIWKWVVIIGAGAVVAIWLVRRIAEIVVTRKTSRIIEQVVGSKDAGADGQPQGWSDLDDLDGPGPEPRP
jgi:hypothetical protein